MAEEPTKRKGFGGGYFKNPRSVVHRVLPRYGPLSTMVLIILIEKWDQHSRKVEEISQEELARMMGYTDRHIRRLSAPLVEDRVISGIRRGRGVMWYRLHPEFEKVLEKYKESPEGSPDRRVGGPLFNQEVNISNRTLVSGRTQADTDVRSNGFNRTPTSGRSSPTGHPGPLQPDTGVRLHKESGTETKYETEKPTSTTAFDFDRAEVSKALREAARITDDGIEQIFAAVAAVAPDAETDEYLFHIQDLKQQPGVRRMSGFLIRRLPLCFIGETRAAGQRQLHELRQENEAKRVREDAAWNECLCYQKQSGELVVCPACVRLERRAAHG